MRITNQAFEDAYENSNSSEFKALAKQVTSQVRPLQTLLFMGFLLLWKQLPSCSALFQLKALYSKSPQLAKYYVGSTVQDFR